MPVYLIRAGVAGPVKIGHTSPAAYANRMIKIQVDNHERLKLLRLLEGGRALETALHLRFKFLRIRGEWFRYHEAMLDDLGAPAWAPPQPPLPLPYVTGQQNKYWTPERRAEQGRKIQECSRDPVRGPIRLAKYRATMALKRVPDPFVVEAAA